MSWGAYITNSLVNKQDAAGHVYNNVLTEAAIMGLNGAEWAKTAGLTVKPDEIKALTSLFDQKSNSVPSIMLGGKKYQVTHYEQGTFAYLKIKDGGATVAKTNQAFIIGVYNTTKKYKYDGKELPQSVGMCNTVVEELANQLNYDTCCHARMQWSHPALSHTKLPPQTSDGCYSSVHWQQDLSRPLPNITSFSSS